MKPSKRILLLTVITLAIVLFWLVPDINTARATKYTRIYEDTDRPIANDDSIPAKILSAATGKTSKKYKTESIKEDASLSDIKASMFSRAIHFNETLVMEELLEGEELLTTGDTVNKIQLTTIDSVGLAAIDTLVNFQ